MHLLSAKLKDNIKKKTEGNKDEKSGKNIKKWKLEKVFQRLWIQDKGNRQWMFHSKLLIFNNYITLAGQRLYFPTWEREEARKKRKIIGYCGTQISL